MPSALERLKFLLAGEKNPGNTLNHTNYQTSVKNMSLPWTSPFLNQARKRINEDGTLNSSYCVFNPDLLCGLPQPLMKAKGTLYLVLTPFWRTEEALQCPLTP